MNMDPHNWLVGLVAVGAGLAGATTLLPTASAHTCAAYDGCDAGACKDGEEHDHTDYNYFTRDEHCVSHEKDPDGQQKGCDFLGQRWPEVVCDVLGEPLFRAPGAVPL